jgi:DNA-binding SARP family transcriptional activator
MQLVAEVLGPVRLLADNVAVELGGPRQRRLLGALLASCGNVVSTDRLIDIVFGGEATKATRGTFRTYVARLRRALTEAGVDAATVIVTDSSGYLVPADVLVQDWVEFEREVQTAQDRLAVGEPDEAIRCLEAALGRWNGPAYGEFAAEEWAQPEAIRLDEMRLSAREMQVQAMIDSGRHATAAAEVEALIAEEPLREGPRRQLMLALYRSGRHAEALRVGRDFRAHLAGETGLEPTNDLVELEGMIIARDPQLDGTPPGRALRGYRLGEQLGEGAFAVVYRGIQPSIGRDVAVKVIRPELANRPEFVRRFEVEAQLVAHLEHPHIVPLYDYWREPGRACLAFRYLRGGTVEARLTRDGPLDLAAASRMAEQVGAALTAAHEAGVVHRDVKPANLFLDEADNFYLGDFGIALDATEVQDPAASLSEGSPPYASPEQLRRQPVGPTADVHGLGVTLFEALTARLPFPEATSHAELLRRQLHDPIPAVTSIHGDVPAPVDEVLARATQKDPADRYQTVEELVADFVQALEGRDNTGRPRGATTMVPHLEERNPYKGLRAFTEADADDFFGRERLVDRLVEMLRQPGTVGRIAAVVGPSGIGKSSVVRAGLLPALRRGAVSGSGDWFVATMMPGPDPFEELAAALLRVAMEVPDNLMSQLTEDDRGLARVIKTIIPTESSTEILLIVDQFEELFTLVDDQITRRRFLDALEHAVTDSRCPLRVVLTIRADFWDRPLRHGSFAKVIDESTVAVTALAPDELERAITEPAHRAGCELEPGLVAEIIADLNDQPGALPLLQYALTELYESRVSGMLTRDSYNELGGVAGAVASRAEEFYAAATPDERLATRRIFERLVSPGEGTEDTRRQALRSEVATSDAADAVIERYGEARLLSFDREQATREPTVEIAHEALMRRWPRLRSWLDEDRDQLRVLRHLDAAAAEWDGSGRQDAELYRGARLETAEVLLSENPAEVTGTEEIFVRASMERHRAEQETQERVNRRLRSLLAAVGTVAVLALIAGAVAFQQQEKAQDSADQAVEARDMLDVRRMVAESTDVANTNRRLGLLLAREAYERDPSPETLGALQRIMLGSPRNWLGSVSAEENYTSVVFLNDGTVVGLAGSYLDRWDTERLERLESVKLTDTATAFALSADGERMAVGYESGGWETRRPTDWTVVTSGVVKGRVSMVAIGRSHETVALAVRDTNSTGTVVHISHADSDGEIELPLFQDVTDLEFGPDDGLLLVAKGNGADAEVFGVFTGLAVGPPLLLGKGVAGAESATWYGSDVVIANDASIALFDPQTGDVLDGPHPTGGSFRSAGELVATSEGIVLRGESGDVELYGPGKGLEPLVTDDQRPAIAVKGLAVSTNTGLVAMVDVAGALSVYSTSGQGTLAIGEMPIAPQAVEIDETASVLMTWAPASVWTTDDLSAPVDVYEPFSKLFEANGSFFMLNFDQEAESTNALWRDGVLYPHDPDRFLAPSSYAELPDGSAGVVAGYLDGHIPGVWIIDPLSGAPIADLKEVAEELRLAAESNQRIAPDTEFTPDGTELVVTTFPGRVFFYETDTWTQSRPPLPMERSFHRIAFSSDGTWAFVNNVQDNTAWIADTENFDTLLGPVPAARFVAQGSQSPDILAGDRYAIMGGAGVGAVLWDLEQLTIVGDSFPFETNTRQPAVASKAHVLATTHDERVVLWKVEPESWPDVACRAAGRNMTRAEWLTKGPSDQPYRATCDRWPVAVLDS